MENTPLARDAQGNPFPLPEEAAFWRVRRHTGGRPSAVIGPDGGPLFLPLSADHESLYDVGCSPGAYRLEAVDVQKRPVGAPIAFIEVRDPEPQPFGQADVVRSAIEALTRTNEAMQRTQLERERASAARERELMNAQIESQRALIESQKSQMQLVVSLFEKITGAGDPVAMLKQQRTLQRLLGGDGKVRNASDESAPTDPMQLVGGVMNIASQLVPAATMWASSKVKPEIGDRILKRVMERNGIAMPDEEEEEESDEAKAEGSATAAEPPAPAAPQMTAGDKVTQIAQRLTPAEREQLKAKLDAQSEDAYDRTMRYVTGLSVDEALAWIRTFFLKPQPPTNGVSQK